MLPSALLLILLLRIHSTLAAGQFQVICSQHPIVIHVGETAVLECQLIPTTPLEAMEIRWTRGGTLVHLYRFGQDENDGQQATYQGRTQLFVQEFKNGNVSLMLKNIELLDQGDYKCFVESPVTGYEDGTVSLNVASLGHVPSINLFKYTGSGIKLLCDSHQWFPAPMLEWRDQNGKVLTEQVQTATAQNPKQFFKVESFIEVTSESGSTFGCLLRNGRLNKTLAAQFHVPVEFFPKTSGWLYGFLLILFTVIALVAGLFVYFRNQQMEIKELGLRPTIEGYELMKRYQENLTEELNKLHGDLDQIRHLSKTAIQRITSVAVAVTLDCDSAHCNLRVSPDLTSVSYSAEAKVPADISRRFQSRLSVLGRDGLASGRHYWEVTVGSKSDWDLGVAEESVAREGMLSLNPQDGYWTIGCQEGTYWANGITGSRISTKAKLRRIGIYVNYEAGRVLFCEATSYSHLHSFTGKFKGKIYPFFNLVPSDEELRICAVAPQA